MTVPSSQDRRIWLAYCAAVACLAVFYVGFCLSPSSYALALRAFGIEQTGVVLGSPKALRSDEWAIWTPYLQIAVNNGFERVNATSPYGEDLRNFNALPLKDWALAFKPQFWAFFLVDPAYAFSLSHAAIYVAFLIGWPLALRALGFSVPMAIGGALLLFFSSYAQLWWTTTGPLLAGFPWILIVVLWRANPWAKLPLLAWLTATWLISHLYPPIVVVLGYVGAAAILAFRRDALAPGNVVACALAAALGIGATWLYLAEPMAVMSQTVYPGARNLGGGDFPPLMLLAHLFPFLVTGGGESLIGDNYLEVATGGSYLLLLILVFLDHGALLRAVGAATPEGRALRVSLAILAAALAMVLAWLLIPFPNWVGKPLLWHLVHPRRFVVALGALLLLLSLTALSRAPLRLGAARFAVAALLVAAGWAVSKWAVAPPEIKVGRMALLVVPFLALAAVAVRLPAQTSLRLAPSGALIAAALLANIAGFAGYNPLQSAWPIFHRPPTMRDAVLDAQQRENRQGWLVTGGYAGATLNGRGFRSIAHVLIAPQLSFFRPFFPALPEPQFREIFNRYAHIIVQPTQTPFVPAADVIVVPPDPFGGGMQLSPPRVELIDIPEPTASGGGNIDGIQRVGDILIVTGWMLADGRDGDRRVLALAEGAVAATAIADFRPDVAEALKDARLDRSGFVLRLEMAPGAATPARLCLWSDANAFGRRLLAGGRGCA